MQQNGEEASMRQNVFQIHSELFVEWGAKRKQHFSLQRHAALSGFHLHDERYDPSSNAC